MVTNARIPNARRIAREYVARVNATPVDFSANNQEDTRIAHDWPIERIDCRLVGTYTVGTSNSTLKSAGVLGLIKKLSVSVEGTDQTYSLPGYLLQHISDLYTFGEASDADIAISNTVGSHPFDIGFSIPINGGPGPFSVLDATLKESVVLEVSWGDEDDIATPGGTHSVSGVKLRVDTIQRANGEVGTFGGPAYGVRRPSGEGARMGDGYPIHIIDSRDVPIEATQSDKGLDLVRTHAYSRLVLYATEDGVPSDDVLNKARVRMQQSTLQEARGDQLQSENVRRYGWRQRRTGLYVFDFANANAPRQPRIADYLSLRDPAIPFLLEMDVTKLAGDTRVRVVLDRYAQPEIRSNQ